MAPRAYFAPLTDLPASPRASTADRASTRLPPTRVAGRVPAPTSWTTRCLLTPRTSAASAVLSRSEMGTHPCWASRSAPVRTRTLTGWQTSAVTARAVVVACRSDSAGIDRGAPRFARSGDPQRGVVVDQLGQVGSAVAAVRPRCSSSTTAA